MSELAKHTNITSVNTIKSTPVDDLNQLIEKYQQLPALYRQILQIKALLFYMRRKTDFEVGLVRSELRTTENKKLYSNNLNPILKQLQQNNYLTSDYNCNSELIHYLANFAVSEDNPDAAANLAIMEIYGISDNLQLLASNNDEQRLRSVHLAVYTNNSIPFEDAAQTLNRDYCERLLQHIIIIFYKCAIDEKWLKTRCPAIQVFLICAKLKSYYDNIAFLPPDIDAWVNFYTGASFANTTIPAYVHSKLLQIDLSMGLLAKVRDTCANHSNQHGCQPEVQASLEFFNGNYQGAINAYEEALKLANKSYSQQEWFRGCLHVFFYMLALVQTNNSIKATSVIANIKKIKEHPALDSILQAILHLKQNNCVRAKQSLNDAQTAATNHPTIMPILLALIDWLQFLLEQDRANSFVNQYKQRFYQYQNIQQYLAAHLYAELIIALNPDDAECITFIEQSFIAPFKFLNIVNVKQPWEYAIDQLHAVVLVKPNENITQKPLKEKRLAWFIDPDKIFIDVLEQKLNKNRQWTSGKAIAMKRLLNGDPTLDYLTTQDLLAIQQGIRREVHGWYHEENIYWDSRQTIKALVGHPLVFHMHNPSTHIELIMGEVDLQLETVNAGYRLSLTHHSNAPRLFLEKETANSYRVIDFSTDAVAMSQIISGQGIVVPMSAKEKVLEIVHHAKSGIRILSDITDENMPTISGNATCCIHFLPLQEGLKINIWVRPFGDVGPYYRAAHGQNTIIAIINTDGADIKQKAIRDFTAERANVASLLQHCPTLEEFDNQCHEFCVEDIEKCLDIILEFDEYKKKHAIKIEWPKGQSLKIKQSVSFNNLSLSIKGQQNWFEYDGKLVIDQDQVLDMKSLMGLLEQDFGRFIKLSDGEFIALTDNFKKQLEELKRLSEGNKIYNLGSGALLELATNAELVTSDASWSTHLERLRCMEKHQPIVPSTLQATLRDYQEVGFAYLSRLAHWEIGACLADDMGLGKTVQTIALMLEQANNGPCLVIAPTSVCFIWQEELLKFAPTLNVYNFNDNTDRSKLISSLDKMDVLICSYGLLNQEGDSLVDKAWQLIVLDEAQSIKNANTLRWQYATKLNGKCRIALTGTPIENHLGELWSIFRFLNPGLLGSMQSFQNRFAIPIERARDPIAKRALKNLIAPYLLRRMKSEVLQELPAKTEQSILIEPTAEESAFYEAVRLKALERIKALNTSQDRSQRFSILAEISRLRQACCHSSLVDENIQLESSKIKTFLTLVNNLIENKHKVLVFSQYVRYLKKVQEILACAKISYQYLDGTTPAKDRKAAVDAFQAGAGDVFLISLKAGGTGLNLNAADYVIILDPWWNPAVEDQASDRAHRIGQQRPVTVYRLIMQHTIEEKILKLHQDKRDLASDLLSGGDMSGKITEEELIELIRD